jgi:hypothetical protein
MKRRRVDSDVQDCGSLGKSSVHSIQSLKYLWPTIFSFSSHYDFTALACTQKSWARIFVCQRAIINEQKDKLDLWDIEQYLKWPLVDLQLICDSSQIPYIMEKSMLGTQLQKLSLKFDNAYSKARHIELDLSYLTQLRSIEVSRTYREEACENTYRITFPENVTTVTLRGQLMSFVSHSYPSVTCLTCVPMIYDPMLNEKFPSIEILNFHVTDSTDWDAVRRIPNLKFLEISCFYIDSGVPWLRCPFEKVIKLKTFASHLADLDVHRFSNLKSISIGERWDRSSPLEEILSCLSFPSVENVKVSSDLSIGLRTLSKARFLDRDRLTKAKKLLDQLEEVLNSK